MRLSITRAKSLAMVGAGCGLLVTAFGGVSESSASAHGATGRVSATASRASNGASGKKFTIALVPGNSTDPFYLAMKAAASAEAKKLGMGFIWQAAAQQSANAQAPVLAGLLARKPSALLVAPTDATSPTGILKQYRNANIPIITLDTTISDTSLLSSRITSDNLQGGAAAADACGRAMKGSGDAAVLYTTPGSTTADQRGQGFIAEMKKKYSGISVLTEYDNNEESTATAQVSSLLLAHPNLKCVFGTNDYAAEGAAQAVKSSGDTGKVTIAGYDAEPEMVSLLKSNAIQVIIAQKPALEAQMAVQFAYDLLTGKKSRVKRSVALPNVTMTRHNIDEPSISKWIYK